MACDSCFDNGGPVSTRGNCHHALPHIEVLPDLVFVCWHKRRSFPITVRGKPCRCTAAVSVSGTYMVCLDCCREFPYDWLQMKMLAAKSRDVRASPSPTFPVSRPLEVWAWPFAMINDLRVQSGEQRAFSWVGDRCPAP